MKALSSTTRVLFALVLALAMIASACSSDAADTAVATADDAVDAVTDDSTDEPAEEAEEEAAAEPAAASGGEIDYLGWEGYDTFFGANADEIDALGVTFNATYMASPADIASRFASGGGDGLDLIAWTSANHQQYRSIEGVLSPITEDEVPNLAGLIEVFGEDRFNQMKDDDGNWLAIPFSFGPLGITYDQTKVSPTSYADLLGPEYEGVLGIPDVPGLHVQAASAALGYDPNTLTPEQLDDVIEFMRPLWAQARVISPSFGDIIGLLASGEISAAYGGYPGLGAFTENPDIVTIFPEEGTFSFVEVYSIPAGADNRQASLDFINAMLDPATNAAINDAFAQATTIEASIPLISAENQALYPYDDLDGFFAENWVGTLPGGADGAINMGDFIDAYSSLVAGG